MKSSPLKRQICVLQHHYQLHRKRLFQRLQHLICCGSSNLHPSNSPAKRWQLHILPFWIQEATPKKTPALTSLTQMHQRALLPQASGLNHDAQLLEDKAGVLIVSSKLRNKLTQKKSAIFKRCFHFSTNSFSKVLTASGHSYLKHL